MTHVEYRCADGSPFPVTFARPDDATQTWLIDREHTPLAMTPLADAVGRLGLAGGDRAWAECDLPLPPYRVEAPQANGYGYYPADLAPSGLEALVAGIARLIERFGSTAAVWEEHCLPRAREACAWLEAAPADTSVAAIADRQRYALEHTMVLAVLTRNDLRLVADSLGDLFGDETNRIAHELTQGYDNVTLQADGELWRIARMDAGSAERRDAIDGFLATFGRRSTAWTVDHPTWLEDPDAVEAQLALLGRPDAVDPRQATRQGADRRRRLIEEIDAALAADDDRRARVRRRVERAASYVPIREERALWQLIAVGAARGVLLRRGRALVEAGLLDDVEDVFYLTADEADSPNGDLGSAIAERRVDVAHWRGVTPPTTIGGSSDTADTRAGDASVRGVAAGRGVARGTARIVVDLADASRLQPGDVLVCRMTSPPWTPLFAIASAVVADTGDVVSHVAIAAREYGLPCVVATRDATTRIPDGAAVVVDGDAGTVTITSA